MEALDQACTALHHLYWQRILIWFEDRLVRQLQRACSLLTNSLNTNNARTKHCCDGRRQTHSAQHQSPDLPGHNASREEENAPSPCKTGRSSCSAGSPYCKHERRYQFPISREPTQGRTNCSVVRRSEAKRQNDRCYAVCFCSHPAAS
jgi:hypothetical protein